MAPKILGTKQKRIAINLNEKNHCNIKRTLTKKYEQFTDSDGWDSVKHGTELIDLIKYEWFRSGSIIVDCRAKCILGNWCQTNRFIELIWIVINLSTYHATRGIIDIKTDHNIALWKSEQKKEQIKSSYK